MKKELLLITLAGSNLALMSSVSAATYGGDATGAIVTVTATGTTIRAASGTLSISGGMAHAALPSGDIPGSATGGVVSLAASAMHSAVVGSGASTRAEGSMGAIGLTVSGNQISSDFLMARSTANCGPVVGGASELVNLVINGQAIAVTGAPNQTIALPNGSVVINEQLQTVGATSGELVVRALHVKTRDNVTGQPVADVSLASAEAKIDCAGGSSPGENWVTGGGYILGENGNAKATFGFVAGPGGNPNRGHLTVKDHSTGATIHGTVITSFTECVSGSSQFEGTDSNNQLFQVVTKDGGEPGAVVDEFGVSGTAQNGSPYVNGPLPLGGGNVQTHGFSCQ